MLINDIFINWNEIDHNSYLKHINAINSIDIIPPDNPLTFFVGENGSGRFTLLEVTAIADGFNPEGGTRNCSFATYNSHSKLCDAIRL